VRLSRTVLGKGHGCGRAYASLEQLAFPQAANPSGVVTLSAGLAMLDRGHMMSVHEVVKEADEALYRAKHLGRNRVEPPAVYSTHTASS